MKPYHFLPVFIALVASYVGLHFYAARWIARAFTLGPAGAVWLRTALLLIAFLSPFAMFLRRHYQSPALDPLYAACYAWMGVILITAFVFGCSDLAGIALRRVPGVQAPYLASFTFAALAFILVNGFYNGHKVPGLIKVTAAVRNLPPELEGFKIAQISDLHLDAGWKLRQLAGIVDLINGEKPDLVLVTGDLIDPGLSSPEAVSALTLKIKSRLGLFGALGNHEYYYGLDAAMARYKAFGVKLLRNESLDLGEVRLIGLGDIHTEHLLVKDVTDILARNKNGKFSILMSHQPVYYPEIAASGDYFVLSGHTHRGQIFPFHVFTKLFYPHFYGLEYLKNSAFYITSGAGTWGPPLRWLAKAEIPLITLTRAK
jgi:hypothetical protein